MFNKLSYIFTDNDNSFEHMIFNKDYEESMYSNESHSNDQLNDLDAEIFNLKELANSTLNADFDETTINMESILNTSESSDSGYVECQLLASNLSSSDLKINSHSAERLKHDEKSRDSGYEECQPLASELLPSDLKMNVHSKERLQHDEKSTNICIGESQLLNNEVHSGDLKINVDTESAQPLDIICLNDSVTGSNKSITDAQLLESNLNISDIPVIIDVSSELLDNVQSSITEKKKTEVSSVPISLECNYEEKCVGDKNTSEIDKKSNTNCDNTIIIKKEDSKEDAFKKILVWPESKTTKKKIKQKERLPSVLTSDKWITIMKAKEEEKRMQIEKKEEEKRIRLEKRKAQEEMKALAKKIKQEKIETAKKIKLEIKNKPENKVKRAAKKKDKDEKKLDNEQKEDSEIETKDSVKSTIPRKKTIKNKSKN